MSNQAIAWVLEQAPDVPPHLVAPLLGLANHAGRNGEGAHPSVDTLAWYTRKDERAVRRDLDKLEALGLIRRGDQRRVAYLPADKRPVVYDLAMERRREERAPGKPGRPRKTQVKSGLENGGVQESPHFPDENRGGLQDKSGGSTGSNRGGLQTPQTNPEPKDEPTSSPREEEAGGAGDMTGTAGEVLDAVLKRAQVPGRQRPAGRRRSELLGLLVEAMAAGWHPLDLPDTSLSEPLDGVASVYAVLRHRLRELGPPPAAGSGVRGRPVHCGVCDERTRMREREGDGAPFRCPVCHPAMAGKH